LKWIWFLDHWKSTKEFNRQDFYLAQIACDIARGYIKNPERLTYKDKMFTFSFDQKPLEISETDVEQTKSIWKSMVGLIGNRKLKTRKPPKIKDKG